MWAVCGCSHGTTETGSTLGGCAPTMGATFSFHGALFLQTHAPRFSKFIVSKRQAQAPDSKNTSGSAQRHHAPLSSAHAGAGCGAELSPRLHQLAALVE